MQVLSKSVSDCFKLMQNEAYEETAKFCLLFDKFFDCLNTRRAGEEKEKRKPDLDPYRSIEDTRFTVRYADLIRYGCHINNIINFYIIREHGTLFICTLYYSFRSAYRRGQTDANTSYASSN